ncbi:MAG TPA: hypothetical protein VKG24_30800 [Pseudolabrys sp.]|nr:hypothetical protein [Pseudolabrys sp.]
METLDYPSWRWGLSLIALTMALHAVAVVMMGIVAVKIRFRLEARGFDLWNLIPIMICIVAVIGLLAVTLVIECGIWAAAYLWLGALDSPLYALLFSIDSMSTRGASGLTLQPPTISKPRSTSTGQQWIKDNRHKSGKGSYQTGT